jgi:trimethylamine--corrinoid protein Co-methyltransferase
VDRETTVARIPAEVVEKAMSTVPHEYTLGARDPEYDLPLDGEHIYISSDGCGVFARDTKTGEVRTSVKQDLADTARVVQALDNVSATSAVVSAQDCPPETRVLHEFDACVRNSKKHSIVVSIKEDWEARSLIKMAEAMAGGREELRKRPMFTTIICTVSPLHQERFGMDLALTLAEAGIPVSFYPMPILGATGPVTIAGSAVVNNAEFLSGAVLVQLAHPGAPVMHGGGPTAMYMNSGAYASNSPEALLLRAAQGHMADFYGVPAWYGAGATTAKEPGIQSAYENALAMFMAYANGADVTFGTGLLDGSRILCLENMVVDDEIIGMVKRMLTGIEVSEETLAVDLIKKMGFNGNYLFDNHTRAHVRELWQASLGETGNYDGWKSAGAKSTTEKAQEKVAEILTAPAPEFPADLGAEFDAIIAAAAREAAAV